MNAESKVIGIDLGTTNSVVAVMEGDEPVVIPNQEGGNKTPSVVAFLDDNECIVGEIARRQAATNPKRTISSIKRLMGVDYEDIEQWVDLLPFDVVNHEEGGILIDVNGFGYSPEQVSALVLKKLKESADAYLEQDTTQAVITVPAHFDDNQRNATIEAARLAGLEVLRLLNEPTAAALAYGIGKSSTKEEVIAVYDFGGGTFDITVLEITDKTFEVLTTTGDTHLGGDDLDNTIVGLIVEEFEEEHGVDLTSDPATLRRLKEVAEKAKCELSATAQTIISLPFISYKDGQPLHLDRPFTRDEFEELVEPFINRTVRCCKRALDDAGLNRKDIDKVVMVGGSTRIPLVQDAVEDFFGLTPFKGVNPDEVVALGAATQAGVFAGNIEEVTLIDVAPHSLGIEVKDGKFSTIIEKNATIPIKAAKNFTTTEENQSFVNIHILQGENDEASENRSLGKFSLTGIPPAPRGRPRIRVTFFVNADGVMEISAEELGSGAAQTLTIVHSELDEGERRDRRKARQRRTRGRSRKGSGGGGRKLPADATGVPTDMRGRALPGKRKGEDSQVSDPAEDKEAFAVLGDTDPGGAPTQRARQRASRDVVPLEKSSEPKDPTASVAPEIEKEAVSFPAPQRYGTKSKPVEAPEPNISEVEEEEIDPPTVRASSSQVMRGDMGGAGGNDGSGAGLDDPTTRHHGEKSGAPADGDLNEEPTRLQTPPAKARKDHDKKDITKVPTDRATVKKEPPTPRIHGQDIPWPEIVRRAMVFAAEGRDTGEAQAVYRKALDELAKGTWLTEGRFEVLRARAHFHMMLGQAEEYREIMNKLILTYAADFGGELLELQDKAIERFVPLTSVLQRDRARCFETMGNHTAACEDMEQAHKSDPIDSDLHVLERLYRRRIDGSEDPAAKFKLVKILLRTNRIDDAVELLQELQHTSAYETRAIKILGLCHWQKNLHFLAWQKFKQLEPTEEINDILFRLAGDMESSGQLNNAVTVYDHIARNASDYRDVQARIKKLHYRIKIQREESEDGAAEAILSDPRFTIIEEINRGSMGIIYKARDKTLDEVVALKVLNDYLCTDPTAVERFKREARAAKKLSHPYIVRIHDLYETGTKRFISMEYIEGTDLKRMLAERTHFSEEQLVYYFLQVADALSYAHRLNVIHRDIKPANIMITHEGEVKVTDFGIAKILKSDEATKSGTAVIGTPLYMAPEQITGEGVDARSDIYSLGIMMYELISGHPPFYLGNIEYHHIHTAPPPLPESVSPRLRQAIMRCMKKDPAERYQRVEDLFEDLKDGGGG
ncbi:MAG: molecular chaperone DnaK [Candidatus Sumerlaeia bacterium]|nr:molecular chaperone DnaK [Candidatus Sumerlaeia bacterium]